VIAFVAGEIGFGARVAGSLLFPLPGIECRFIIGTIIITETTGIIIVSAITTLPLLMGGSLASPVSERGIRCGGKTHEHKNTATNEQGGTTSRFHGIRSLVVLPHSVRLADKH
jgi:hypothetical protein